MTMFQAAIYHPDFEIMVPVYKRSGAFAGYGLVDVGEDVPWFGGRFGGRVDRRRFAGDGVGVDGEGRRFAGGGGNCVDGEIRRFGGGGDGR